MRAGGCVALTVLALVCAAGSPAFAWKPSNPVPEIADPTLNDIAAVRLGPHGPQIHYNPTIVASVSTGTVEFFYAHEYGHVELGHLRKLAAGTSPYWSQLLEKEAGPQPGHLVPPYRVRTCRRAQGMPPKPRG